MTKVKICGITNLEDALFAASLGADALGFNFYTKSPRYIEAEIAAGIIRQLSPGVSKAGVFVNETIENIVNVAETAGLDAIQLHGDETSEFIRSLRAVSALYIIKAIRVSPEFEPPDVLKYDANAILLDAYSTLGYGGTGKTFDWESAIRVRELAPKMYLAGGLSPENVGDAIQTVGPYAVDACSCLERGKGIKDNMKVRAFIAAAKGV